MSHKNVTRLLFSILCCFSATTFAGNTPLEQTKAFVDAMKNVKTEGEKSYSVIDRFINYDQLTQETIKPHIKSFNDAQIALFKPLLEDLIRLISYPQSGDFYTDSSYTYQSPIIDKNKAYVGMELIFEKEDLEMELGYFWRKFGDEWQLVDLSFDEDSLVKDYQNQFGRLIAKDGVDNLIKKLQDKVAEIEKDNKQWNLHLHSFYSPSYRRLVLLQPI